MKNLTGNEIRQMFLDFFKSKGHQIEPSAPLVPIDDDTLLWINSGVATLKKYFDGRVIPDNPKITNAQKSIRTNDVENVGFTARHHTFFEMLGNFSIGDYFKKEAIEFAYEFLTSPEWLDLDEDKIYVTIHPEDEEAYALWHDMIGLDDGRIIRIEGNFWDIGVGPSGPNTEIFYDRGEAYGQNDPANEMYPGGENERYLEIWNLVFSEFNHNEDNTYTPLPKQNIDTGMGLERITSVIQNTETNYETDLIYPIIEQVESMTDIRYTQDEYKPHFKIISDHVRTVTFAIGDGALPSSEGRGYILRRLIRRAVRFGTKLNFDEPFMYKLVPIVIDVMREFYPEVEQKAQLIQDVLKSEEARFFETIEEGEKLLLQLIEEAKSNQHELKGRDVFKLYDTFGFPVELTREYADEHQLTVDEEGFKQEMQAQQQRAREARNVSSSMQVQSDVFNEIEVDSEFVGYESSSIQSTVSVIVKDGSIVDALNEGDIGQVILKQTPFYAESGGQVADRGVISSNECEVNVTQVSKAPKGQHLHQVEVKSGTLKTEAEVNAQIDTKKRSSIVKNHTATHLLHQVLKDVLGDHVNQAGSLVDADKLRFDFSHFGKIDEETLSQIEEKVNEKIFEALNVDIQSMPIDEAKKIGAMALFGEKYGDIVRVVNIEPYSIELCGGTHVTNTSQVGLFKITSESGTGAGVRRIEAITGHVAYDYLSGYFDKFKSIKSTINVKADDDVISKAKSMAEEIKAQEKEIAQLKKEIAKSQSSNIEQEIEDINGVKVLVTTVEADNPKVLREIADDYKSQLKSYVIYLMSHHDDKVSMICNVSDDVTDRIQAGQVVKESAPLVDGRGGGRKDSAQGGGTNIDNITNTLQFVKDMVKSNV